MNNEIDMKVTIQGIDLPRFNRSARAKEIYDHSVPIDSTDIEAYNKEGNCTHKIIHDMPDLLIDGIGRIYTLYQTGKIATYIHRNGEKRIVGYRGRFGEGYMLLCPDWKGAYISKVGYYIRKE